MTCGKLVSMCASRNRGLDGFRNAWPECGVGTSAIEVDNELVKNPPDVQLIERDQVIETFSSYRADESFAVGVRGGTSERRAECSHPHHARGPIQISVEHRTAVVDQELVLLLPREGVAELLNGPLGARMAGQVAVQDSARADFHDDEHVQYIKAGGDHIEEVAGDNVFGVVADEGAPTHRAGLAIPRTDGLKIFANRPGRDLDAGLQKQLVGDALFAPGWVGVVHLANQDSEIRRNRRPTSLSRFPSPQHSKRFPVPAYERLGFDDYQGIAPIEEAPEQRQPKADPSGRPPWSDLALLIKCQLAAEKKDLGKERRAWQEQKAKWIGQELFYRGWQAGRTMRADQ